MVIPELPEPWKTSLFYVQQLGPPIGPPIFHQPLIAWGPRLGCPPMVPGRLSPSSFICNEAECESPEVIYGASRWERSGERACLGYGQVNDDKWIYDDIWICYKYMNDYDYDCIVIPGQCMPNSGISCKSTHVFLFLRNRYCLVFWEMYKCYKEWDVNPLNGQTNKKTNLWMVVVWFMVYGPFI